MTTLNHVSQVIAIDGPSGSGKSSMAKRLAKTLGLLFIDTGAMFRAIGLYAHKENIPFEEGEALSSFLSSMDIRYTDSATDLISINGQNLTSEIRHHEVSLLASTISQLPTVRTFLLNFQRSLAKDHVCVMEGRDIGTVVFPDAFCKIFVTASAEVRATRRLDQLKSQNPQGDLPSYEQVLSDVIERDRKDTQREVAPLKVADGAKLVDTSDMRPDDVLNELVSIAKSKASEHNIAL